MSDRQQAAPEVTSPCIGVCHLRGALCIGCCRTIDEIAEWPLASAERQREVVAAARVRQRAVASTPAPAQSVRGGELR